MGGKKILISNIEKEAIRLVTEELGLSFSIDKMIIKILKGKTTLYSNWNDKKGFLKTLEFLKGYKK